MGHQVETEGQARVKQESSSSEWEGYWLRAHVRVGLKDTCKIQDGKEENWRFMSDDPSCSWLSCKTEVNF